MHENTKEIITMENENIDYTISMEEQESLRKKAKVIDFGLKGLKYIGSVAIVGISVITTGVIFKFQKGVTEKVIDEATMDIKSANRFMKEKFKKEEVEEDKNDLGH